MGRSYQPTAPVIFGNACSLIQQAAAAQSPPVPVYPFALTNHVPGVYILVHEIEKIDFVAEDTAGGFQEHYDLEGQVVVFTGEGVGDTQGGSQNVTINVLNQAWALFTSTVLSVFASNRNMPILGYSDDSGGAGPYQSLLGDATYLAQPGGTKDGKVWGWKGVIDWAIHFDSVIWPFATS